MQIAFEKYIAELRKTALDAKTEHTDRAAIEHLLQAAADDAQPGAHVQHEPRRDKAGGGSPDFKVIRQGRIAGYVEVKTIDENLSKVLKSDQIRKYKTLSDNLILTDYLEFCWIKGDGEIGRQRLFHSADLENPKAQPKADSVEAVRLLLRGFFSATPQRIAKAKDLALALASRAAMLRDFLTAELIRQEKTHREGRLHALFDVFKQQVFHDLTVSDFTDAFAQMLAYGLFLARLNAGEHDNVTLTNVRQHIPTSFTLIRELVRFLEEMNEPEYTEIKWVVEEVLSLVNGIDLAAIHNDLSFRARKAITRKVKAGDEEEHRLFERDPFIYFYEDFLKAYDPAMRKGRGVYYTPPPVVNFIVRAVDDILKDGFGIKDGLADHNKVTVLDFACGTGTFLLEVFQKIFENIGGADSGKAGPVVREHITKNLFGFEYLIAPYTIAHLKLSQYLRDQGHPLTEEERLQVFLTNTLEPVEPQYDSYFPAISREVAAAQKVKDREILVIVGNPPYSGHSKNKGQWITEKIGGYKYTVERRPDVTSVDGFGPEEKTPLGERNPKWLNDDYVKFIRFAQLKMDAVDEGIVAIITNHSWLENPTFRGMRQSLMRSFDQIYVLDLHGNAKKKERAPDGSKDENVFDIEQGVAISLFVKRQGLEKGVWRGDLWGKRIEKYRVAAGSRLSSIGLSQVKPSPGGYLFTRQDEANRAIYEQGRVLTEIFPVNVLGFQTHRDAFAISFTKKEMEEKLRALADEANSDSDLLKMYGIKSNRDWSLAESRAAVRSKLPYLSTVTYRPFDLRWSEFGKITMDYPRREILDHVAGQSNLSLLAPRQIGTAVWRHVAIADSPAESCMISSDTKSQNQVFPLRLRGGTENLSPAFRAFIDARYDHHHSPEEVLGYIYAVLHAPAYRTRFTDFLRIDFPRIPFAETKAQFDALADLGWTLVQAHLLREVPAPAEPLAVYHGKGDNSVEAVRYSPEEQAIWINKVQRFAPVPQAVWDFHIGGYQVLDKYLKSRKGRVLSLDELNHVGDVAATLAFTIDQMMLIDTAYRSAFKDGE